jgi:hypothetical protein
MSYRVTYLVNGAIKIPDEVIEKLRRSPEESQRIREIQSLGDDMTLRQYKELQKLKLDSIRKTIDYNGAKITTKEEDKEPMADLYVYPSLDGAYIPGFEGGNLDFYKKDNTLVAMNGYIDDNYDANINLVVKVAKAFESPISIVHYSDEEEEA